MCRLVQIKEMKRSSLKTRLRQAKKIKNKPKLWFVSLTVKFAHWLNAEEMSLQSPRKWGPNHLINGRLYLPVIRKGKKNHSNDANIELPKKKTVSGNKISRAFKAVGWYLQTTNHPGALLVLSVVQSILQYHNCIRFMECNFLSGFCQILLGSGLLKQERIYSQL